MCMSNDSWFFFLLLEVQPIMRHKKRSSSEIWSQKSCSGNQALMVLQGLMWELKPRRKFMWSRVRTEIFIMKLKVLPPDFVSLCSGRA